MTMKKCESMKVYVLAKGSHLGYREYYIAIKE